MNQGLIPSRYAKALYKFAVEKGKADRVYVLMKNLEAAFAAQPRLQEVMNNPYIAVDDKTRLLMTAAEAEKTDSCYVDFLKLLVENKRIDFSRGIALAYLDIYREENNIYLVRLITAADLPQADPELIGGFVININSERLDASISNELKQLRLKLLSN